MHMTSNQNGILDACIQMCAKQVHAYLCVHTSARVSKARVPKARAAVCVAIMLWGRLCDWEWGGGATRAWIKEAGRLNL